MTTSGNLRRVVLTFGDDCHPSSNYFWKLPHAKFRRWKHLRSRHMWFIIQVFCTYSAKNIPQFFCFWFFTNKGLRDCEDTFPRCSTPFGPLRCCKNPAATNLDFPSSKPPCLAKWNPLRKSVLEGMEWPATLNVLTFSRKEHFWVLLIHVGKIRNFQI